MTILVIDNDDCFCRDLVVALKTIHSEILIAHDQSSALGLIFRYKPDKVVLEQQIDSFNSFDLIKPILEINNTCRIIVLSRYACIANAVRAVKMGAFDYLPKPVDAELLFQSFDFQKGFSEIDEKSNQKPMSIKRFEWEYINTVLVNKKGNISATARELGLDRRTLQRKLKKYPCII